MHLVATLFVVCMSSAYVTAKYNYSELLTVSLRETNGETIRGEYIVVFREDVTDADGKLQQLLYFTTYYNCLIICVVKYHMTEIATHGRNTAKRTLKIIHEYQIGAFRGYSARMDQRYGKHTLKNSSVYIALIDSKSVLLSERKRVRERGEEE